MSDGEAKVTIVTIKFEKIVKVAIGVGWGVAACSFGNHCRRRRRRRNSFSLLVVFFVRLKLMLTLHLSSSSKSSPFDYYAQGIGSRSNSLTLRNNSWLDVHLCSHEIQFNVVINFGGRCQLF